MITNGALNENIHINQIGYRPDDKKVAVINGMGGEFKIVEEAGGAVVFTGCTTDGVADEESGDTVYHADFTSVKTQGKYYVSVPGFGRSFPFIIGQHAYSDVKNALLKAMYYQRCGIELEEKHAGPWKHSACHLQDGHIYFDPDKTLDGAGGWHDAGDYGKYTVPGAYAAAYLLYAYDFFKVAFQESINIPESGNGTPDILIEARFELDWLFKLQDRETGGVFGKLTSKTFPDELAKDSKGIMPEEDLHDLFFFPITSTATADFAAVMALAARLFTDFDGSFSHRCIEAAERAWNWLEANRELVCPRNPQGVVTGDYWDNSDRDERYWAAAELYRTTMKREYNEYVIESYKKDNITEGMWWRQVGGLGNIAYLFTAKEKVDENTYYEIRSNFLNTADKLLDLSKKNGYRLSLQKNNYIWGSNLLVMNAAFYMIVANMIKPDNEYIQAAQGHFDYLLGCNTMNQCYVTGYGSKPILHPHHRPSVADGVEAPIPGLVSGGPNAGLQDELAKSRLTGNPPAKCFIDSDLSYATNEIAIYWNTPAVFVAGYFDL